MRPLGEYPVGNMTRVHGPAERQHEDMSRASLAQSFGAYIHRGTGCKDVIDQQDALAGD
jgi:hypothetical protein